MTRTIVKALLLMLIAYALLAGLMAWAGIGFHVPTFLGVVLLRPFIYLLIWGGVAFCVARWLLRHLPRNRFFSWLGKKR